MHAIEEANLVVCEVKMLKWSAVPALQRDFSEYINRLTPVYAGGECVPFGAEKCETDQGDEMYLDEDQYGDLIGSDSRGIRLFDDWRDLPQEARLQGAPQGISSSGGPVRSSCGAR